MAHVYIDSINCEGGVPIRTPSGSPIEIQGNSTGTPLRVTSTDTFLVEGQSGQGGVDGNFTLSRQITNTGTVKSSAGFLNRITVNKLTQTTIRIYDTTTILSTRTAAMRGTISEVVIPAGNLQFVRLPYQGKFTKGLRILLTTATDITISYR